MEFLRHRPFCHLPIFSSRLTRKHLTTSYLMSNRWFIKEGNVPNNYKYVLPIKTTGLYRTSVTGYDLKISCIKVVISDAKLTNSRLCRLSYFYRSTVFPPASGRYKCWTFNVVVNKRNKFWYNNWFSIWRHHWDSYRSKHWYTLVKYPEKRAKVLQGTHS